MSELKASVLPTSAPAVPQLVPVAFINLKVAEPQGILQNGALKQGINQVQVIAGEITTIENSLGYEISVSSLAGSDHITANTDSLVNRLDCKIYGKTPNGSGVYIQYGGVIKISAEIGAVLGGKAAATDFSEQYVTSNPVFHFADTVEEQYKWALRENIIGKGRFVRDEENKLYVQYYLYVLV